jgi:hypothetical protein
MTGYKEQLRNTSRRLMSSRKLRVKPEVGSECAAPPKVAGLGLPTVCVRVCACVRVCVRVRACASSRERTHTLHSLPPPQLKIFRSRGTPKTPMGMDLTKGWAFTRFIKGTLPAFSFE